jgi:hypothetical protein
MQARLGYAHVGEYYKDFNPKQYCAHVEKTTRLVYTSSRTALYSTNIDDEEQNIIPTDLFGTKEGIARFTEFLTKTNAFERRTQE